MALITKAYVKQNFPQWDFYAGQDTQAATLDEALDNKIATAEAELADYITVDATTMTPAIERHLFNIVRKHLFDLKHGDSDFERDPQIVADYKRTLQMLTDLREGDRPSAPPSPDTAQQGLKITSKNRRFNKWFRDNGSHEVDSTTQ